MMASIRTSTPRLPRVLMLHGYTQNSSIFSKRVAALRKVCQAHCEMVFVDAPHVIEIPTTSGDDLNKFDSTAVSNVTSETDPSLIPRAWWRRKDVTGPDDRSKIVYEGFDESVRFIRKVIDEQGPFEVCFGFSQGAAFAGILSSILERPSLHPAFSDLASTDQKPFKAVILVSGFKLDMPQLWPAQAEGPETKLKTRSLHVIGTADTIISEDQSRSIAQVFSNPRIEVHEGSHFVPSKKSWRDFFSTYMKTLDQNDESLVPSPASGSLNENPSQNPKF